MTLDDFDKIWCLHAVDLKKRYKSCIKEFNKVGIADRVEFRLTSLFKNIKISSILESKIPDEQKLISDATYHCTREHYTMVKIAYTFGYDHILICEDDIKLIKKEYWDIFMSNIPDDFDIIRYRYYNNKVKCYRDLNTFNKGKYYVIDNRHTCWSTGMYALSHTGMKYYLDYIENTKYSCLADRPFYDVESIKKNNLRSYLSSLIVAYEYNFKSAIGNDNLGCFYDGIDKTLYE